MMKHLTAFFLLSYISIFAALKNYTGKVLSSESGEPLANANVIVLNYNIGATTDESGIFNIRAELPAEAEIAVSFIGYETSILSAREFINNNLKIIYLKSKILQSQTVLVKGSIGDEMKTPTSFSKIKRKELAENHTLQDVPEYLSYLPSTTFYSENGNGLGYNYLSIRGFDQRRISISINGIPQNDPEDHNLYWVDLPDLLAGTEMIQVQRGAGSGITGYPAIGGSINIITSPFSDKFLINYKTSVGSYNTIQHSFSAASGLIDNKYSIYANIGKIRSSGYRQHSWVDFTPIRLSAVRYDKNLTTQLNFYGGPVRDAFAYYGIPKSYIKDRNLRKTNYYRPEEQERFWQPHLELLNEFKASDDITINSALFLVTGNGYFDYDGSWSVYYDDYFRLKENGFDSSKIPQNALIRAMVENVQWGWIPRVSIKHRGGELIIGSEFRFHNSTHWGSVNYAENLPAGVTKDYRYYYYEGGNNIISGFVNENYEISERLNLLAEIQLAYHKYKLTNEKYVGTDFNVSGLYLNPRLGLNFRFTPEINAYASFARVTREPRLKNYYDAAESSGGAKPQFEIKPGGGYDFNSPLVNPETMNDLEIGTRFSGDKYSLSGNIYYMAFRDEIVKNGRLDRFGEPVTGNIEKTNHYGIELTALAKLFAHFEITANASYGVNKIEKGGEFVSYSDGNTQKEGRLDLSGNKIGGFPNFLFNLMLRYRYSGLFAQVSAKYVGGYYSNNYADRYDEYNSQFPGFADKYDNAVEPYFLANILVSYQFGGGVFFRRVKLFGQVNNLFDNLFASHAVGDNFFPYAERNFLVGLEAGL